MDAPRVLCRAPEGFPQTPEGSIEANRSSLSNLQCFQVKTNGDLYIHSTKDMSLPVRPPIPLKALLALEAALLTAGPAEEVTLDRPSEALEVALVATSFDCEAALAAVSVVEAYLRPVWRVQNRLCRMRSREGIGVDMATN